MSFSYLTEAANHPALCSTHTVVRPQTKECIFLCVFYTAHTIVRSDGHYSCPAQKGVANSKARLSWVWSIIYLLCPKCDNNQKIRAMQSVTTAIKTHKRGWNVCKNAKRKLGSCLGTRNVWQYCVQGMVRSNSSIISLSMYMPQKAMSADFCDMIPRIPPDLEPLASRWPHMPPSCKSCSCQVKLSLLERARNTAISTPSGTPARGVNFAVFLYRIYVNSNDRLIVR